jgi:hypothetical protein
MSSTGCLQIEETVSEILDFPRSTLYVPAFAKGGGNAELNVIGSLS